MTSLALLLIIGVVTAVDLPNGSINVMYDFREQHVRFTVLVQDGTYTAFGWGPTMTNTDMVVWQANGKKSTVLDLYSTGHNPPSVDAVSAYDTKITVVEGFILFESTRDLDGRRGPQDFVA